MRLFRRKEAVPEEKKSASYLFGLGAGTFIATNANYQTLASDGYIANCVAFACINRIANAISSIEPQLYRRGKGGKLTKVDDHNLLDLLERPNPAQSGKEFIRDLVIYLQIGGNSYVFGNGMDKQRQPSELQLLNPGKVTVKPGRGMFPQSYEYRPTGNDFVAYPVDQTTGQSQILQIKTLNPLNPWAGLSPLLAAAYGIDIHNSGQRWNKKLLDNDARPSGALKVVDSDGKPSTLSEEQYGRLKEMIDRHFSGAGNAGKPLLLEGGLEWEALSLSAKDMDYLQAKHSSARDIALTFGVPPQLIGIPGDSTFANYEQAMLSFWTDTVLPTLCLVLEALNRWLTPRYGENLYLWYDEEMIPALEPRRKAKADRINAATYLTVDEKRNAMGYESLPEGTGNVVLVQASTIPLDLAGQMDLPEPGSPADEEDEPDNDGAGQE